MGYWLPCKWTYAQSRNIAFRGAYTNWEWRRQHTSTTCIIWHWTCTSRQWRRHRVGRQGKAVPWNNAGRQSDPKVRHTLVHVGPTMGGALTLLMRYYILCHDPSHGGSYVAEVCLIDRSMFLSRLCGPEGYTYTHMSIRFHGSLYPMTDFTLRA